ncbi:MAG TPA: NIL domain-containing protein [Acidimicrobiales bacterium]|nr:NIL domain-containing protein [Acidimicrobiales bacterium]
MTRVRLKLTFPESLVRAPVIARLVRDFDVVPNIRRAEVRPDSGWMLCEVVGEPGSIDEALAWLREEGVTVDLLGDVLEG